MICQGLRLPSTCERYSRMPRNKRSMQFSKTRLQMLRHHKFFINCDRPSNLKKLKINTLQAESFEVWISFFKDMEGGEKLPAGRFYTQKLLHTEAFPHRSFYTQKLLHTEAFYTQTLLHTEDSTHRSFYTQKLLYTEAFPHRSFSTQKLLHTEAFYTQKLFTDGRQCHVVIRKVSFYSVFDDRSSFRAKGFRPTLQNRNFTPFFGDRILFRATGLPRRL